MTTFAEMKILMEKNGWEAIAPETYLVEKRMKHQTARIGDTQFYRLKKQGCGKVLGCYYFTEDNKTTRFQKLGNCGERDMYKDVFLCTECAEKFK